MSWQEGKYKNGAQNRRCICLADDDSGATETNGKRGQLMIRSITESFVAIRGPLYVVVQKSNRKKSVPLQRKSNNELLVIVFKHCLKVSIPTT